MRPHVTHSGIAAFPQRYRMSARLPNADSVWGPAAHGPIMGQTLRNRLPHIARVSRRDCAKLQQPSHFAPLSGTARPRTDQPRGGSSPLIRIGPVCRAFRFLEARAVHIRSTDAEVGRGLFGRQLPEHRLRVRGCAPGLEEPRRPRATCRSVHVVHPAA